MTPRDALSLLKPGVTVAGETWADLGAGRGTFTVALSELLDPAGRVVAVDRNARALRQLELSPSSGATVHTLHADFTGPLELPRLDGLLLANALHFVERQVPVLKRLGGYLRPGGRVLFLEYDTAQASPWNPYPLPPGRLEQVVSAAGLESLRELGRRPSAFGGRELYLTVAFRPSVTL